MSSVLSVLTLAVRPGSEEAVKRFYTERAVFEHARQSGGFRSGRLLEPVEAGGTFLVLAEWDDAAAYARWVENPVRAELSAELIELLEHEPPGGGVYRDVDGGGSGE